jgi:hypothetical protein
MIVTRIVAATAVLGLGFGLAACGSGTSVKPAAVVTHYVTASAKATTTKPKVTHRTQAAPLPEFRVNGTGGSTYIGREPGTIDYSGDSGNITTDLEWSSWTATSATGEGYVDIQGCNPDCATGGQTPTPTTITLSNPVGGLFISMTESVQGEAPKSFTYSATSNANWALNASQSKGVTPSAVHAPGSGDGGSGSYPQDIANAGIVAPVVWVSNTGVTLCDDWANGETTAQTDPILLAGGILPAHLAIFDGITVEDVCPTVSGGPNS